MWDDSGEGTSGEVNANDTNEVDTSESSIEISEAETAEAFNESPSKTSSVETSNKTEKSIENGNAKSEVSTSMVTKEEVEAAFDEKDPISGKNTKENVEVSYERPTHYRSGLRDEVWENAKDEHGRVRDPVTGRYMSKDQPWDMGHKPGYEFTKHQESAKGRQISRQEFLDEYNNPDHYRPELPSSNRSHKGESKTENYYD